jgi:uncharacterized protein YceH (UPF0502 family)
MSDGEKNTIRQLTRLQRRVLGTLVEKAFTTPDQYPMTVKGLMTGCNQKSNRDPITEYSEGEVADALEQLRELGLVAEVFTDGGRTTRFRHYMRLKFDFSDAQLGIVCELLLRGRQQPGELRTRASRMVRIESQEQLRTELQGLLSKGFLQASGALERRGVEVDHTWYLPKENMQIGQLPGSVDAEDEAELPPAARVSASAQTPAPAPATALLQELQSQLLRMKQQSEQLQEAMDAVRRRLDRLERELGIS